MFTLIWRILKNKFYPPSDPAHLDFTGRTIIVTGANTGLGYEASLKFAAQNCARLILAVRNVSAGEKAQRIIQHLASDPKCVVEVWELDVGDYDSTERFVRRLERELERVDVAVMNAGVWRSEFGMAGKGENGWEETLLVNALGTVWLACRLKRVMAEKWQARVAAVKAAGSEAGDVDGMPERPVLELVSSGRYARPGLVTPEQIQDDDCNILDTYNKPDNYSSGKQYAASKLFLMCAFIELARSAYPRSESCADSAERGVSQDIYIISVCPGACQSSLSRDLEGLGIRIARFYANLLFLRTTEEGARTLISGTALGERCHGQFWQNDEIKPFAPVLCGEDGEKLQKKVCREMREAWARDVPSEALTGAGDLFARGGRVRGAG